MFINYRHYSALQLVELIAEGGIYFSRHSSVEGINQRPDVIALYYKKKRNQLTSDYFTVTCEMYNNVEGLQDILSTKQFVRDEKRKLSFKEWKIHFQNTLDAKHLCEKILNALNQALEDSPLLLYASPAQKALYDYHNFMTKSSYPSLSYTEIMHYLGYYKDLPQDNVNEEQSDKDVNYMVAKYKQDLWAAWASGDQIVPLFPSEAEATDFLKSRTKYLYVKSIDIQKLPSMPINVFHNNLYILSDHSKSVNERIAWLYWEINRLKTQSKLAAL